MKIVMLVRDPKKNGKKQKRIFWQKREGERERNNNTQSFPVLAGA